MDRGKEHKTVSNPDIGTTSLDVGFARLRWGMSKQQVRVEYRQTRTTPVYEGRHPVTGQTVVVGGDELIPELQKVAPGVMVNATLKFDADRLIQIDLWPDIDPANAPAADAERLASAARELARSLGNDAAGRADAQHRWSIRGTAIEQTDDDDGWRFELSRPAASP